MAINIIEIPQLPVNRDTLIYTESKDNVTYGIVTLPADKWPFKFWAGIIAYGEGPLGFKLGSSARTEDEALEHLEKQMSK